MVQHTTYSIMLLLTCANAGMCVYTFARRHQHSIANSLLLICFLILEWSLVITLRSLTSNPELAIIFHELKFIAAAILPVAVFLIILKYIGLGRLVKFKYIVALSIIPVFTIILSQTNPWHHIFRLAYDILYQADGSFYIQAHNNYWFYVHVFYSYALWLVNLLILLKYYFRKAAGQDYQTLIYIIALLFPFGTNLIDLFGWIKAYDLTLFALTAAAAFLIFATFFYSAQDLVPLARIKLVEHLPNPIFIYNQDGVLTDANQAAIQLSILDKNKMLGQKREKILHNLSIYSVEAENAPYWVFDSPPQKRKVLSLESQAANDAAGNVTAYIDIFTDVTELEKAKRSIEKIAITDILTGLYNRNYFEKRMHELDLEKVLAVALIIADIDGLKYINDTYGHSQGDELIRKAAAAIRNAVREQDTVARIGGDEFVILMEAVSKTDIDETMKKIQEHSHLLSNSKPVLSMCLGSAIRQDASQSMAEIFRLADQQMYICKRAKIEDKPDYKEVTPA